MNAQIKLQRYNYPHKIIGPETLNNTNYDAILGDFVIPSNAVFEESEVLVGGEHFCHFHDKIAISDERYELGFNEEYLNTSIEGKVVYVPLIGCGQYLYTGTAKYIVSDTEQSEISVIDKNVPDGNVRLYKKLNFTDEKTIGDLYKNASCYSYFDETGCFERLADKGIEKNNIELLKEFATMRNVGTIYSRIESMNTLINFLITKVTLTEEEKLLVEPLLTSPSSSDIATAAYNQGKVIEIANADRATLASYTSDSTSIKVTSTKE